MDQSELRPLPQGAPNADLLNKPIHLLRGNMPGYINLQGFDGVYRDEQGGVISTGNPALNISPAPGVPAIGFSAIKFPATQVPSTDANTLDDYEEGTWTPNVGGSATYSVQEGYYQKIGRWMTISCRMGILLLGTGSNSGIFGIPVQSDMYGSASGVYFAAAASNMDYLMVRLPPASAFAQTYGHTAAGASLAPIATFTNGTTIEFTMTYRTAA